MKIPSPHVHFLSVAQAAVVVGLDRETVKRLVGIGVLRAITLPGDTRWRRIPRSDVVAYRRELERRVEAA